MPSSFIRVVETWVPSQDGTLLEFHQGLYHAAPAFGTISRTMCFGRGEGLPGRVWEERRPLLLPRFERSNFLRTPTAQAVGLRCAVGVPCFRGERLVAVLVLLCGDEALGTGAIELWHHDPRIGSDMTLVDGWFGADGGHFEALSRDAYLPRGVGLPGRAWQRGETVHLPDLHADGARFLRLPEAEAAGLQEGLAIPLETGGAEAGVLTVLASHHLPVAQRLEVWRCGEAGAWQLGHAAGRGTLPAAVSAALPQVLETAVPGLIEATSAHPAALLWPITRAGEIEEVLVMAL